MKKHLKQNIFNIIAKVVDNEKAEAYVVGGFVRDALLNRPCKDIDIVTVGSGIALAQKIAAALGKDTNITVYKNFGTAMLRYKSYEIEFVGARRESYRRDSRKPIVEDGTLADDQIRRDFTINALAISLQKHNYGELVDPFDGVKHLGEKLIKTPSTPDVTFSDDPLRMLRAIRFASQLDFKIEEETFASIKRTAHRIEIISQERIISELNKIILSKTPSRGFKLLDACGLLEIIFPEFIKLKGVDIIDGNAHKENFHHTLKVLDNISEKSDDLYLRWAAVLHDIAKPQTKKYIEGIGWSFHGHEFLGSKMVRGIFRRMKLPLDDRMKYVQKLVQLHLRPIALIEDEVSDSAIRRLMFDAGDDIEDLMTLCVADITSKNEVTVRGYLKNLALVEAKMKDLEQRDAIRNLQPPISGELIMETFNITPCKAIGDIKGKIKDAILDGEIRNDKDEAYQLMLKLGKEMGLKAE